MQLWGILYNSSCMQRKCMHCCNYVHGQIQERGRGLGEEGHVSEGLYNKAWFLCAYMICKGTQGNSNGSYK